MVSLPKEEFEKQYQPFQPGITPTKQSGGDFMSKTSDVLGAVFPGTKQIGESLGTIAAAGGRAVSGDYRGAEDILKTQKTVPELIGAYGAAGATAASYGGFGYGGGWLSRALASAGYGGTIFGGKTAAEGGDIGKIAKNAAIGAGIGGGVSLALSGASAGLHSIQKLPERLIRRATGQTTKSIQAGKDLTPYMLEQGKVGTRDQLIRESRVAIDKANETIAHGLKSTVPQRPGGISEAQNTINKANSIVAKHLNTAHQLEAEGITERGMTIVSRLKQNIVDGLKYEGQNAAAKAVNGIDDAFFTSADDFADAAHDAITATHQVPVRGLVKDITQSINDAGGSVDEAQVLANLKRLAPQVEKVLDREGLDLEVANKLRVQLDKTLGGRAFLVSEHPFWKGVLFDFSNALREQVKGRAPDAVRPAFDTLSKEIRLLEALSTRSIATSRNQLIGMGDILGAITGTVASGGSQIGGLAGLGAKRASESTLVQTGVANLIHRLDTKLTPILSGLDAPARTAIINAIIETVTQGQEQQQKTQESQRRLFQSY